MADADLASTGNRKGDIAALRPDMVTNGTAATIECKAQVHSLNMANKQDAVSITADSTNTIDSERVRTADDNNDNCFNFQGCTSSEQKDLPTSSSNSISRSSSSSSIYHDTASLGSELGYEAESDIAASGDSAVLQIKPELAAQLQHTVEEALREIEISSEETRSRAGSNALVSTHKLQMNNYVSDESFIEVPLNSPGTKPSNSYARSTSVSNRKNSNGSDGSTPNLSDVKPKESSRSPTSKLRKDPSQLPLHKDNPKVSLFKKKTTWQSPDMQRKLCMATSTTGLIFENRPMHLPPKLPKEEEKHRQQYENMVEKSRKVEKKKVTKELKQQDKKKKQEDSIGQLVGVWKTEVLPNWENVKSTRRVKELWWAGLPPSVRGTVWQLSLGNELHITPELFQIFRAHAAQRVKAQAYQHPVATIHESGQLNEISKENTVGLITLDVARTFPVLCIFQKGGPYHEPLKDLLGAYTCYRPDVGYVQGMSFLAAMLILNMDVVDAFIAFTNLLNRPCQMAFFMVDQPLMNAYFETFDALLEEHLPRIQVHFKQENLSHDIYLIDWIFTLYSKSLPLDVSCRVWDLFCRDGESFLFRTALGILRLYRSELLQMEFFHLAQYLTKLSSKFTSDELFQSIAAVNFSKSKFHSLLQYQTSLLGRGKKR